MKWKSDQICLTHTHFPSFFLTHYLEVDLQLITSFVTQQKSMIHCHLFFLYFSILHFPCMSKELTTFQAWAKEWLTLIQPTTYSHSIRENYFKLSQQFLGKRCNVFCCSATRLLISAVYLLIRIERSVYIKAICLTWKLGHIKHWNWLIVQAVVLYG